jgi:cytochrome c-type biogenesis protein CcmH/NrfG
MSDTTPATDAEQGRVASRADLEAERDFLFRSLDDLEVEHSAGDIDDEAYQRLHDDYTARAAAVLRSLRDDVDARPARAAPHLRRRILTIAGVAAFAVLSGVALAFALGARLPGQTSSGNNQASGAVPQTTAARIQQLNTAIARNPSDVTSRLLLAQYLEADNNLPGALQQYDAILKIQPMNFVAEAQEGRVLYLTSESGSATQAAYLDGLARDDLDKAISLDPQYPDAHFFRAILLAYEYQDYLGAQDDLQHYLVLAPNGQFAGQVRALLAQVTDALAGPPATTPTTAPKSHH